MHIYTYTTDNVYIYIIWLVVLTILKHISQLGRIIPYIMEHKTCLKPPTSTLILRNMGSSKLCFVLLGGEENDMWNYSTRHIQSYRKHSMTPCHYHRYFGIDVSKKPQHVLAENQIFPPPKNYWQGRHGTVWGYLALECRYWIPSSGSSMPKEKQRPMVKYPFLWHLLPIDIHCT